MGENNMNKVIIYKSAIAITAATCPMMTACL